MMLRRLLVSFLSSLIGRPVPPGSLFFWRMANSATGGTFTLSNGNQTTPPIPFDASPTEIQRHIDDLNSDEPEPVEDPYAQLQIRYLAICEQLAEDESGKDLAKEEYLSGQLTALQWVSETIYGRALTRFTKPTETEPEPEVWCWSADREIYQGDSSSWWEAALEYFEEHDITDSEATVSVGKQFLPPAAEQYVDADLILEHVGCQDKYNHDAGENWPNASKEQLEELTDRLRETFGSWLDFHNLRSGFWLIGADHEVSYADALAAEEIFHETAEEATLDEARAFRLKTEKTD